VEKVWVQEEPYNMGAGLFIQDRFGEPLQIISRPASGVTAEGLPAMHKVNQSKIISQIWQL
jgi:2-oxoglutarate dehydrogenase E1 component